MTAWDVHSALVDSFTGMGLVDESRIAFEQREFTPPADAGFWFKLFNMPAERVPATLGDEGLDRYAGVFQIDVNGPAGEGVRTLIETAGSIVQHYTAGKRFSKNGQSVFIEKSQMTPVRKDGVLAKVSISVFWHSMIPRNL